MFHWEYVAVIMSPANISGHSFFCLLYEHLSWSFLTLEDAITSGYKRAFFPKRQSECGNDMCALDLGEEQSL